MITKILKNNNIISLLGNGIFAALGFASIFILARTYSKDIFGEWVLYLAAITFVEMLRLGITRTALVRFLAGAKTDEERQVLIGSSWVINIIITIIIIIIIYAAFFIFNNEIKQSGFWLFFIWYPILSVIILPFNTGMSILQSRSSFNKIIWLRLVSMGTFVTFITVNYFVLKYDIEKVVIAHLLSNILASIVAVLFKFAGIKYIVKASKKTIKTLYDFGKFSLGTLIGSNLLKSSDTFIIGIMMTKADVAIYSIPLKLIEVIEIPLRSFVDVALPKMSKASRDNNNTEVEKVFYKYSGILTILLIPVLAGLFIFAEELVWILGGDEYTITQAPVTIFRIFLIYGLFLSIDRFTGVTLDSINKPKSNLIKVIFMVSANIIGDILAIHFFDSIEAVAVVTIINVLTGVYVGIIFLKKHINIKFYLIPLKGIEILSSVILKK